jgi:hypothetical protein
MNDANETFIEDKISNAKIGDNDCDKSNLMLEDDENNSSIPSFSNVSSSSDLLILNNKEIDESINNEESAAKITTNQIENSSNDSLSIISMNTDIDATSKFMKRRIHKKHIKDLAPSLIPENKIESHWEVNIKPRLINSQNSSATNIATNKCSTTSINFLKTTGSNSSLKMKDHNGNSTSNKILKVDDFKINMNDDQLNEFRAKMIESFEKVNRKF